MSTKRPSADHDDGEEGETPSRLPRKYRRTESSCIGDEGEGKSSIREGRQALHPLIDEGCRVPIVRRDSKREDDCGGGGHGDSGDGSRGAATNTSGDESLRTSDGGVAGDGDGDAGTPAAAGECEGGANDDEDDDDGEAKGNDDGGGNGSGGDDGSGDDDEEYDDVHEKGLVTPLDPLVKRKGVGKVPTLESLMECDGWPTARQASAILWCAALRKEVESEAKSQGRAPAAAAEAWALLSPIVGRVAQERMLHASALRAQARAQESLQAYELENCMSEPEVSESTCCAGDNCFEDHSVEVSLDKDETLRRLSAAEDAEHRLRALRASDAVSQFPADVTTLFVSYTGFARSLERAASGDIHDSTENADVAIAEETHDSVPVCGLQCARLQPNPPSEWECDSGKYTSRPCVYRPAGYPTLVYRVFDRDGKTVQQLDYAVRI